VSLVRSGLSQLRALTAKWPTLAAGAAAISSQEESSQGHSERVPAEGGHVLRHPEAAGAALCPWSDPGSHSEVADLGCRSCCDLAPMSRIETGAFGPVGRGTGVALASDVSRLLSAPVPFPLANAHSHSHVGRTFRSDNSNGSGLPVISLAQPSLSQLANPCLERIDRTAALPAQGWTDSAHLSCTQS
jgi:hypothetical protein